MLALDAYTCPICGATVPTSMPHNCNDHMTPPVASAPLSVRVDLDLLDRIVVWRCTYGDDSQPVWHEGEVPESEIRPIRVAHYAYPAGDVLQAQGALRRA